ncbi:hypothetical protein BDD12DRAFT_977912 [Trichophaea hybrida]|nr:hypothetical protein BDD12DRAFT_977912 [Trichophaea hybrida]
MLTAQNRIQTAATQNPPVVTNNVHNYFYPLPGVPEGYIMQHPVNPGFNRGLPPVAALQSTSHQPQPLLPLPQLPTPPQLTTPPPSLSSPPLSAQPPMPSPTVSPPEERATLTKIHRESTRPVNADAVAAG